MASSAEADFATRLNRMREGRSPFYRRLQLRDATIHTLSAVFRRAVGQFLRIHFAISHPFTIYKTLGGLANRTPRCGINYYLRLPFCRFPGITTALITMQITMIVPVTGYCPAIRKPPFAGSSRAGP